MNNFGFVNDFIRSTNLIFTKTVTIVLKVITRSLQLWTNSHKSPVL